VLFQLLNRLFFCTEDEQMGECYDTASPKDESPSENDDSDVDPNYSLSGDSYSDSSDSKASSLQEVSVSALKEKQNVHLTIE